MPKLFNLRTDPFERADTTSNTYWDWYLSKAYMILAAQAIVAEFLATFTAFPPRQKAASFTIDQALEKMDAAERVVTERPLVLEQARSRNRPDHPAGECDLEDAPERVIRNEEEVGDGAQDRERDRNNTAPCGARE